MLNHAQCNKAAQYSERKNNTVMLYSCFSSHTLEHVQNDL